MSNTEDEIKLIVNLFYLSPNPYGGWVTYTSHLMDALRKAGGIHVNLFKVRPKSEKFERDLDMVSNTKIYLLMRCLIEEQEGIAFGVILDVKK